MAEGTRLPIDWITYFAADSADDVAQRVRAVGGTLALGPLRYSETAGRMAVAADLCGALFGIWEGREHPGWGWSAPAGRGGLERVGDHRGEPLAAAFYGKGAGPRGAVGVGQGRAGRGQAHPPGGRSTGWPAIRQMPRPASGNAALADLFAVDRWTSWPARAKALGGSVEQPPADTPYGRAARLGDPEGGPFSVVRLNRQRPCCHPSRTAARPGTGRPRGPRRAVIRRRWWRRHSTS